MRRAIALLMLCLVIGTATGAFAAIAEAGESCAEECGEGEEGCCPLVCPRCVCAERRIAVDVPQTVMLPSACEAPQADTGGDVATPESIDPGEIFHVPIAAG